MTPLGIEPEILACSLNKLRHGMYPIPHYKVTSPFLYINYPLNFKINWGLHSHKSQYFYLYNTGIFPENSPTPTIL